MATLQTVLSIAGTASGYVLWGAKEWIDRRRRLTIETTRVNANALAVQFKFRPPDLADAVQVEVRSVQPSTIRACGYGPGWPPPRAWLPGDRPPDPLMNVPFALSGATARMGLDGQADSPLLEATVLLFKADGLAAARVTIVLRSMASRRRLIWKRISVSPHD